VRSSSAFTILGDRATHSRASDLILSVCVPYYGKPPQVVREAVSSAAEALPPNSELLVLPDGPAASEALDGTPLPPEAQIFRSDRQLGLVGNWNRCLDASHGELIHILHDDDAVDRDFYRAILNLRRRYPLAALYGTASASLEGKKGPTWCPQEPFFLEGSEAAAFLLADRYAVGGIAIVRQIVLSEGPFRPAFPDCPDEEAYLRFASVGGIAFSPRPLYRVRTHAQQARYASWEKSDFVSTFVRARVEGASRFGPTVAELATHSSAERVISIAISLALSGKGVTASQRIRDLGRALPRCRRWPRYWLARAAVTTPLAIQVLHLRRKYLLRRGVGTRKMR
jgi:Glycosyl transferase family 2